MTIKEQFKKVVSYSQNIPDPQVDDLFSQWEENKKDFITAINNDNFIYEWPEPITLELSTKDKKQRIDDFINMIATTYYNEALLDFLEEEKSGFFSNMVVKQYEYEDVVIPQGMKLLKAFKYFEHGNALNDIQSAASMIIQEDKIKGRLCFSVHPLDFLSSSENTHNWRSCHALDGEYRGGNLCHMIDGATVMVYLKSDKDTILPNFPDDVPWNSKKWRVLLYFSNSRDMIFAGRQYPFTSETGMDFIVEELLPMLGLGHWSDWNHSLIKSIEENGIRHRFESPYVPIEDSLVALSELVIDKPGSKQFNDVLCSSCYSPIYSYKMVKNRWYIDEIPSTSENTRFEVGGEIKCLRCGKKPVNIFGTFMCDDCELEYGTEETDEISVCECCGRRFFYDDGYSVDDIVICESCAKDLTDYCANCGTRYFKEDLIYNRDDEELYCRWCDEDARFMRKNNNSFEKLYWI